MSRNPFLDPALARKSNPPELISVATTDEMSTSGRRSPTVEDIFDALTLDDKTSPPPPGPPRPDGAKPPIVRRPPPPGGDGTPPIPGRRVPPPNHRPNQSQEEALRARKIAGSTSGKQIDVPRSPTRRPERRPRRNSESSVVSGDKVLTDEERKAKEARRRERERRHREHKDKKPSSRKLDVIDQLDATGLYGAGMFHHDGPFDALNPHRNKGSSRRAPMQAFPKDSLNNSLGGAGPLNARPDHATLFGNRDEEAFKEWSTTAKAAPGGLKGQAPVFDPMGRDSIYGDESMGLGTTTFLEGTPAARAVIQKHEEERAAGVVTEGLQRKKSLAQRFRSINRGQREFNPGGRMTNPDGTYAPRRSPSEQLGPASSMTSPGSERNPFFNEFDSGRKGEESISVRKTDAMGSGGPVSPSSPKPGLERRATADACSGDAEDQQKQSGGLLARVKSLKGGGRRTTRPTVPESTYPPTTSPGTAV